MKLLKNISIFTLFALLLQTMAYANTQDSFTSASYHRMISNGIPQGEGRYIKLFSLNQNTVNVSCWSGLDGIAEFYSQAGTYTNQFFICTDVLGTECELLGTDEYTVVKQGDDVVVSPAEYIINVSNASSKYPSCNYTMLKGKHQLMKR